MNVRVEAVAMESTASINTPSCRASLGIPVTPAVSFVTAASIFRRLSIGGHSISAVTPDTTFIGGVAAA